MKFIARLTIKPSLSLTIKNTCTDYIETILSDFNVSKLVFNDFVPNIIDSIMNINYDNITKLVLYGSSSCFYAKKSFANKFINFLDKLPNLK
jgi:hypothetical protein